MANYPTTILGVNAGTFRAYYLACVVFICGFKAGYDSGVSGGVLTMGAFMADYGYTKAQKTHVNSMSTGLQQLGAFVISFALIPFLKKLGRKPAILVSAAIFAVGAIVQTANTHSLTAWYIARFVAGMGVGGCSMVVPTYSAEMAPKEIRGRIGSFYQWFWTMGAFASYWIDYGMTKDFTATQSAQWMIPIGIQLVAPTLLFLGTLTLPESARWLIKVGRTDEAWKSLTWLRSSEGPEVQAEFAAMKDAITSENKDRAGLTVGEMLTPANRKRLAMGTLIFLFQMGTGATALAFFGPQFFQLLVGQGDKDLLLTAFLGAIKLIATTFFIFFIAERFGRKTLLSAGGVAMCICMSVVAGVYGTHMNSTGALTPASNATLAFVFMHVAFYNISWGPIPWAYAPEIWTNRTRELGMGMTVAAHWLFSFVFSFSTPYMMASMEWGIFAFYAVFCAVMAVWAAFFIKETRDKVLETVNAEIDGSNDKLGSYGMEDADKRSTESYSSSHKGGVL